MKLTLRIVKSFPGHAGIPGHRGGSLPKSGAATGTSTQGGAQGRSGKKLAKMENILSSSLIRDGFKLSDSSHLMYRVRRQGIIIEDKDGWNGNMTATVSAYELERNKLSVKDVVDALVANGATKIKRRPGKNRAYGFSFYD